jgi:cation transport ATPase
MTVTKGGRAGALPDWLDEGLAASDPQVTLRVSRDGGGAEWDAGRATPAALTRRPDLVGLERLLWASAALTAALAALAAVRRVTGASLEGGTPGQAAVVALEIALGALLLPALGGRYFARTWQALLRGRLDRHALLGLGLTAALVHGIISAWAPRPLLAAGPEGPLMSTPPSLAMAGALLTLLLLGEWLERCEGLSLLAPPPRASRSVIPRAPFVTVVNFLSRWLTWIALAAAVTSFVAWAAWGPEPRAGHSLMSALAVLFAACPAALGLVAPLAVRAAVEHGGDAQIYFRGFADMELLRRVDTFVIDELGPLANLEAALDAETVRRLHREGVKVMLLTPEGRIAAEALARRLGLDDARAEASSSVRAEELRRLRAGGRTVALITDGAEDPMAAVQAHLVIALSRRDSPRWTNPGLRLASGSLADLLRARRLSRATVANIKENISFTFVSSALAIPFAAGAVYPVTGTHWGPMAAALAAAASALIVILNSLRLRTLRI